MRNRTAFKYIFFSEKGYFFSGLHMKLTNIYTSSKYSYNLSQKYKEYIKLLYE